VSPLSGRFSFPSAGAGLAGTWVLIANASASGVRRINDQRVAPEGKNRLLDHALAEAWTDMRTGSMLDVSLNDS